MACSPARLAANRANSLRSSGPKSEAGKARSRANAVKHGLSGAGIALSTQDAAEVDRRFSAMERELKPEGELAGYLVRRVAGLTFRVERCMRHESKMTADRVRHALDDHDERRAVGVDEAFARLSTDPAASVRALLRTPEGVDRMIGAWLGIKDDLARKQTTRSNLILLELAENLSGRRAADLPVTRPRALWEAICLNFQFLDERDGEGLDPSARRAWAKLRMIELIDGEVEAIREVLEAFDLDEIARGRAEAVDRALFDPSKAGVLARRYEAAAERALYQALDQLKDAQPDQVPEPSEPSEPADLPPAPDFEADEESPDEPEPAVALGSFGKVPDRPSKPLAEGPRKRAGAVPRCLEPAS